MHPTPYIGSMKTFQGTHDGDTLLRVNKDNIDIDKAGEHHNFVPTDEDRISIALAVLGDPPPLTEAVAPPEEVAKDKSLTDGELRFNAINALMALEIRREQLRAQTAEAKAKAAQEAIEEKARKEQIDRLESAYIKTLTKRRWSTAASRAIATTLYNQGARIPDPDAEEPGGSETVDASTH